MASVWRSFRVVRVGPLVAWLCLIGTGARAEQPGAGPGFAIDDQDPVSSVPGPQQAVAQPLQMGYLLMELAERADAATEKGDHVAAARYYEALGKAVPDRAGGVARACAAHEAAGNWAQAAQLCREALGKPGVSLEDHARFVRVSLKASTVLSLPELLDIDAVLERLEEEGQGQAAMGQAAYLRCDVGLHQQNVERLTGCLESLTALGEDGARPMAYRWALAMLRHDDATARALLSEASAQGVPDAVLATMRGQLATPAAHGDAMHIGLGLGLFLLALLLGLSLTRAAGRARRRVAPRAS